MLSLHGVNKSSSGLYRCQILDLDDMMQMEKEVELVVNCKAPGGGTGRGARTRGGGAPRLSPLPCSLRVSPPTLQTSKGCACRWSPPRPCAKGTA